MKKKLIICTVVLATTILLTGCGKKSSLKNGETTLVSFKDFKISSNDYYDKIKNTQLNLLIEMFDLKLFEKYKLDDEDNKRIEEQIKEIKKQYSGDNENNFNLIILQYYGVNNEKELKEKLSLEIKREKAINKYIEDHITKQEVKNYYNNKVFGEMKASHILIRSKANNNDSDSKKAMEEEKALNTAKEIIKKLNKKQDFAKLAKKYSEDDANKGKGGDLGYFKYEDMVDSFSEATKSLKINEYTKEPVKTTYGYHIILKTGEKKKPSLKSKNKEIRKTLREEKLTSDNKLFYKTLYNIRKDNKLKWNDSKLEKAYRDLMKNYLDDNSASAKN